MDGCAERELPVALWWLRWWLGMDGLQGTVVEKLSEEVVNSAERVQELLREAERHRRAGEHAQNENSSRSHMIVRMVRSAAHPSPRIRRGC